MTLLLIVFVVILLLYIIVRSLAPVSFLFAVQTLTGSSGQVVIHLTLQVSLCTPWHTASDDGGNGWATY